MRACMREIGLLTRPCRGVLGTMTLITEEVLVIPFGLPYRQTGSGLRGEGLLDPQRAPSDQTEMSERLLDCLPLLGRAGCDAPTPPGPVRCTARRHAAEGLDMRDPTGFRDEAVVTLNKFLYLAVGGHRSPSSSTTGYPSCRPDL